MITEIAQIEVKPGTEVKFEKGVKQAIPIFKRAKGCRSMELRRSIEKPNRYRLFIGWDTVENHTNDFRGSADFQEWRKLVAHCFASPPHVEARERGGTRVLEHDPEKWMPVFGKDHAPRNKLKRNGDST